VRRTHEGTEEHTAAALLPGGAGERATAARREGTEVSLAVAVRIPDPGERRER